MKQINHKLSLFSIPVIVFILLFNLSIAQENIVDKAIEVSGMVKMRNAEATFIFREDTYEYRRQNGQFTYTRIGKNKENRLVRDVYTNKNFVRHVTDTLVNLTEKRKNAYTNSVNSVIYFAFLPLWLKDPAVILEDQGRSVIKGKEYHKILVTFKQEGGGHDFEDVFLYWFDVEDYSMDYLAYKYFTGKGGMRFREAYNTRKVNGVLLQDYRNLQPKIEGGIDFDEIEKAFENEQLEELSLIILKNVKIKTIPKP
ncbi:hypothetical protein C21_02758 [Arenibacter sp. NBRC 103722]|uniref:DUF6503 family protein n=1 Tax=Arenibacter sp. NBRC 103722 TaxID=1113929 RepID=UPI0008537B56|nr:DUF6503 family protein [Arenibacter sp. NBRC 103722]GBF20585.1 hypothetical protein C21_02758 [Arenibacter sp. NBRC 103722]